MRRKRSSLSPHRGADQPPKVRSYWCCRGGQDFLKSNLTCQWLYIAADITHPPCVIKSVSSTRSTVTLDTPWQCGARRKAAKTIASSLAAVFDTLVIGPSSPGDLPALIASWFILTHR